MIRSFLFWFTADKKCRLINRNPNEPYLERYYLGTVRGVTFYLHRFVNKDADKETHDHPWSWAASVVLCGSYVEEIVTALCPDRGPVVKERIVSFFNWISATRFHRISTAKPETWTLFFHGKRVAHWGFLKYFPTYDSGRGEEKSFISYNGYPVHSNPEWWKTAPTARNIGREPYNP